METSGTARIRRFVGPAAVAGALALVLVGMLAAPAMAQTRKQAASQANDRSIECLRNGGEPDASSSSGTIRVSCTYDDGSVYKCHYYGEQDYKEECEWVMPPLTHPTDPTHGVGGVADGGVLDGGATPDSGGSPGQADAPAPPPHRHHKGKHGKR